MTGAAAPRFSGMRDFRKLIVWQKGHRLVLAVYTAVRAFPPRGYAGVANQITRAAASIAATVAEGCGKSTDTELARFTDMALASAKELGNHLILARDLGLLDSDTCDRLERQLDEVCRMLFDSGARYGSASRRKAGRLQDAMSSQPEATAAVRSRT